MSAYMVAVMVLAAAMSMGALVFFAGYRTGVVAGVDRAHAEEYWRHRGRDDSESSDVDEQPRAVGESSGRHHLVPPSDDHTESFPPVRPDDMLADDDSIPGKALRDFYRPQWPADMPVPERELVAADSHFARTADAADRGGHQ